MTHMREPAKNLILERGGAEKRGRFGVGRVENTVTKGKKRAERTTGEHPENKNRQGWTIEANVVQTMP
jgi:hypothetical protein